MERISLVKLREPFIDDRDRWCNDFGEGKFQHIGEDDYDAINGAELIQQHQQPDPQRVKPFGQLGRIIKITMCAYRKRCANRFR